MYNEALKLRFLSSLPDTDSTYYTIAFRRTEPFESAVGHDLCLMTESELSDMFRQLCGFRRASTQVMYPMRVYITWCLDNQVPGARKDIFGIDVGQLTIDNIRTRLVASPAHLQSYLDSLLDPESELTSDNAMRCMFWLAYAGVVEADALKITASDVNLSEMLITHGFKTYNIYREAVPAIKNCMERKSFFVKYAKYEMFRDRIDGDELIRIFAPPSAEHLRVRIARMNKDCGDVRISYSRAWLSGVFYRMFEFERMTGIKPNFRALAAEVLDGQPFNLSDPAIKKRLSNLTFEYSADYERWKKAYKT